MWAFNKWGPCDEGFTGHRAIIEHVGVDLESGLSQDLCYSVDYVVGSLEWLDTCDCKYKAPNQQINVDPYIYSTTPIVDPPFKNIP